jgi:hypothetical protein
MSSWDLPQHLRHVAETQLAEGDNKFDALEKLKSLIAELPEEERISDQSDNNLVRFLRSKKFEVDKALISTRKYAKFYNNHREALKNLNTDQEFKAFSDSKFLAVSDAKDLDGRTIIVLRQKIGMSILTREYLQAHPRAMLRFNVWLFEELSKDIEMQVNGVVLILTFSGFSWWDNLEMQRVCSLSDQFAIVEFFSILALRFKGAFFFEAPSYLSWFWFFVKPFVSEKVYSRFHFCAVNYSILKDILPVGSYERLLLCLQGNQSFEDAAPSESFTWIEKKIAEQDLAPQGQ